MWGARVQSKGIGFRLVTPENMGSTDGLPDVMGPNLYESTTQSGDLYPALFAIYAIGPDAKSDLVTPFGGTSETVFPLMHSITV